jgi:hypothetical protein
MIVLAEIEIEFSGFPRGNVSLFFCSRPGIEDGYVGYATETELGSLRHRLDYGR